MSFKCHPYEIKARCLIVYKVIFILQVHRYQSYMPMGFRTDASTGQNLNMHVFLTPQAN